MKAKIRIKTPDGQARGTETKLRPMLLNRRLTSTTYTNDLDNEILWEIEGPVRDILKATKNVNTYEVLIKHIFQNKLMKKFGLPKLAEGEADKLKELLENNTTVEIIKEATAQELIEANVTWWDKLKSKFKKEN